MGLINQKNGLFHDTLRSLGISDLQAKYRFQIRPLYFYNLLNDMIIIVVNKFMESMMFYDLSFA
jgi:hypothetical protein